MKSAYHIFKLSEINAGLTAYAAVNLCQKCGRNLDKINSPKVGCCAKSGQIPCYAAAKGNYKAFAVKFILDQALEKILNSIQVLMGLSSWESELAYPIGYFQKFCLYLVCIERCNCGIGNDTHAFSCKSLIC